jgi:membrane protein DedA with SNARE-associated domain
MLKKPALILMLIILAGLLAPWGRVAPPPAAGAPALDPNTTASPHMARLERDLKQAVARVQPVLDRYGYPVVFLTILVEGVGIPAPGQTILIAAALAAAHGSLNIVWVLIWAGTAALLGNSLGYLLGRWGGRPLLARLRVRGDRLARLEERFRRYGGVLVLVARFFDGLRQLNGIVAGMLKMPWWVFTGFNVPGALLWTGAWGLGAYWLDKDIGTVHHVLHRLQPVVVALTLVVCLGLLVHLFRHRQSKGAN